MELLRCLPSAAPKCFTRVRRIPALKLLQEVSGDRINSLGHYNVGGDEQIPAGFVLQCGEPDVLHTKYRAGLSSRWNFQEQRSVWSGNFQSGPENGFTHGYRQEQVNMATLSAKIRMRHNLYFQQQIPWRPTTASGRPLRGKSYLGSGFDPCRHADMHPLSEDSEVQQGSPISLIELHREFIFEVAASFRGLSPAVPVPFPQNLP